jgi:polar amino acid transport system substrate-binding protein
MQRSKLLSLTILFALPAIAADPAQLAPTGTLRAAFLGDNPVQGRVDPATGTVTGPVADLTKELAQRLGVSYKIIPAANAKVVIDHVKAHTADIGFLAYDETRAEEVDFTRPYVLMQSTYLVRADSDIAKAADADRPGKRIGAVKGQTPQIYLSRNLKNAQLRSFDDMPPFEELQRLLTSGELDAFGANRQRMVEAAARSPKLRALADNYSAVEQSLVVLKGRHDQIEVLDRFLDEARDSGLVKVSIERAKIAGAEVAPAGISNR